MYNWKKKLKLVLLFSMMLLLGCNPNSKNKQKAENTNASIAAKGTDSLSVQFSTYDINKKYYNKAGSYLELILKLPKLKGNYTGIPKINSFFATKDTFFLNQLDLNDFRKENYNYPGGDSHWFRSADYKLEAVYDDVISMSAILDGGMGGVSWDGIEGDVFNLTTGKKLELSDLFKVSQKEYMPIIFDFVKKSIMKNNFDFNYGDPYSGDGLKAVKAWQTDCFYLTNNTLVIFYEKYALACGAEGVIKFEIPLKQVSNILKIHIKRNS